MSTYSPSLRIELITTGDQAGTWGNTTNTNMGTLIESAIAGYVSVSITSANQALTALNGAADQSRNMTIALTTTTTAPFNVYAPPAEKTYVIYNASGYTATVYNSTVLGNTTAAGTGVAIPAGKTMTIWSDGTNFAVQNDHLTSLTLSTDLAIADGGTGASTAADARTNLGLGTMATQAANNVAITGGSITGITDLAVADGGTGASSFTSGGILRGNGGSALSVASASDIVSAIGSTAVANATNAGTAATVSTTVASGATGTTQAYGTNNTTIATTAFVQAALQALYPVGSVYMNADSGTSPATLLGFGSWAEIGAGRVLIGQNVADPAFDALGETGGSSTTGNTTPSMSASTTTLSVPTSGYATATSGPGTSPNGYMLTGTGRSEIGEVLESVGWTNGSDRSIGGHTHTISGGDHSHSVPTPPYLVVKMWKRTA